MAIDILDSLITIVITLFILSVITEKLTQLVRSYPKIFQVLLTIGCLVLGSIIINTHHLNPYYRFWLLFTDGVVIFFCLAQLSIHFRKTKFKALSKLNSLSVLNNIGKDLGKEIPKEVKETEISILSFLIGLFVGYCFNVDLIGLFNSLISPDIPHSSILGRGEAPIDLDNFMIASSYVEFNHLAFIGFLMTGFFLAFGSKFFHDLLDTLLQIKELKRKLNDKETYKVSNIKEFDDQMSMVEKDMVKCTFDRKSSAIMSLEGVIGASCGSFVDKNDKEVYGIKIYTSKPELILENSFNYQMPNGNARIIPLNIIQQTGAATICVSLKPSAKARHKLLSDKGSVCFAVRSKDNPGEKYLLTCYHVVKGSSHSWESFYRSYNDNDKAILDESEEGDIYRGVRNREMDAALITMEDDWVFQNSIPEFQTKIKSSRPVYYFDDDKTTVNIYGAATKEKRTGTITGIGARYKISFNDHLPPFEMVNLFEIQNNNRSIVVAGDSGSIVFTDKGEAVGMVVATTPTTTLAIPIETILTTWNLELNT
jgi:hypothetical protein